MYSSCTFPAIKAEPSQYIGSTNMFVAIVSCTHISTQNRVCSRTTEFHLARFLCTQVGNLSEQVPQDERKRSNIKKNMKIQCAFIVMCFHRFVRFSRCRHVECTHFVRFLQSMVMVHALTFGFTLAFIFKTTT